MLDLFGRTIQKTKDLYVEDIPEEKLIESALNGMLTDLDPHSSFLSKRNLVELTRQTKGTFGGLGMEITSEGGVIKIVSPIDDSPADKADLHSGDQIISIDGQSTNGMSIQEAADLMRGPPNTTVTLTIVPCNTQEIREVTVARAIVKVSPVKAKMIGNILYIRIATFTEQTTADVIKEINKHSTAIYTQGLILDLRDNPGGLLDQAIGVADTFLDKGEIVSTKGRNKSYNSRYNAKKGDRTNGLPMAVLINSGSASASEIVAGALKDHKRAIIVGTRSFGKGSVQAIIKDEESQTAIRITTARYYTPSGHSIQAQGIEPHIYAPSIQIAVASERPEPYAERNLPRHLKNTDGNKSTTKKTDSSESQISDYALIKAIDALKTISVIK